MTALVAYSIVALATIVGVWALGFSWVRRLNAADAYREAYTIDRTEPTWVRESMQERRSS